MRARQARGEDLVRGREDEGEQDESDDDLDEGEADLPFPGGRSPRRRTGPNH